MARGGGGKRDAANGAAADDPEQHVMQKESERLRNAAISRGILSRSAAKPAQLLRPSKTLLKCDGKDIVKKGNRKTKYLFSFPGLVAPVAGGKFGDLAHLDTRNPVLYVDFPQGRLKLFGTIVYPKNKYLTLQISKGSKSVLCDDFFEALVVFSEAWWIGSKEDNPEELKLEMPGSLQQEKHENYDFAAGAGDPTQQKAVKNDQHVQKQSSCTLTQTTLTSFQSPSVPQEATRHSARTSGRKRSYAEVDISSDEPDEEEDKPLENVSSAMEDGLPPKTNNSSLEAGDEEPVGKKRKTILDFMVQRTPTRASTQKTRIDTLLKK